MSRTTRTLGRASIASLAAAGLLVAGATTASAHVTVSATETAAGAYTVLTFSVPHGCEDSPTGEVAIQIPEPINRVTPTVNPGWEVEMVNEELAEPVDDGHGGELTERVDQVVYTTDDPLPSNLRDTFELSLQLPESTAGQDLVFPTVQTCPDGEAAWVQVAEEGSDGEELDMPAPVLSVTEAATGDEGAEGGDPEATAATQGGAASSGSDSSMTLAVIGLAAGVLGLATGGLALVSVRRRG